MKRKRTRGATAAIVLLVVLAGAGAYTVLHRLGCRWGASATQVWPWLVQMGYGRAGWYTNDWSYRLIDKYVFHVNMPRVDRILPELQHLAQGDVIPDGPPGTASFTVTGLEPARTLALYSTTHGTVWLPRMLRANPRFGIHGELGWAFVLREPAKGTTRLILRTRGTGGPALYRVLAWALLPPADFLVARMLLETVKRNVEQAAGQQGRNLPETEAMQPAQ